MQKSTKFFTLTKYQKKIPKFLLYHQFWSILFLQQGKIIILKCFQKNVNMLLKKKRFCIIDGIEISSESDRENSDKEN